MLHYTILVNLLDNLDLKKRIDPLYCDTSILNLIQTAVA